MGRPTIEESKRKRAMDLQVERNRRYKEKHNLVQIKIEVTRDKYDLFDHKLTELGMTKKQFIEDAIDKLLESGK